MRATARVRIARSPGAAPNNVYIDDVHVGQCQWVKGINNKRVLAFLPRDTLDEWRYAGADDLRLRLPSEWKLHRRLPC